MLSFQIMRNASRSRHQHLRVLPRANSSSRGIVTESIEPPLSSLVREKPCTLVLVEDQGLYDTSWHSSLRHSLPNEHGLQYCQQTIILSSLVAALSEMTDDLAMMPSVVLLTRGPVASWVAQYYLESVPLAGLIMVDPVLEPSSELLEELKSLYSDVAVQELNLLNRIQSGAESRPYLLEPGVVPMLVLSSINRLQEVSRSIAHRHSNPSSPFGEVQIGTVENGDPSELINDWIEDVVL